MRLVGPAYLTSELAVNLLVLLDPLRQVQIGEHPNTLWGLRPAQLPYGHLFKRRSEQERSSPWRKPEYGCLGDQLVGIPRPPPSCRAWSNSSDTRRLAKIQRADFANSAPARGRREGCRGSGVGKKIMHGPWMSWRTSIRADEFRPIFYAPPVRRTIIYEQYSQPSSCLLVAGALGFGRRKRA